MYPKLTTYSKVGPTIIVAIIELMKKNLRSKGGSGAAWATVLPHPIRRCCRDPVLLDVLAWLLLVAR